MIIYVVHWETYDTAGICKSISIKIPTGLMFFFLLLFHIADVCKNYMALNYNFLHFCQLEMLTKLEEKELQEEKIGGKQEDNF